MIRNAHLGDVEAINEMAKMMVNETKYKLLSYNDAKLKQFVVDIIENEHFFMVAEEDGKLIGMFAGGALQTACFSDDLVGIDFAFYVIPEKRGNGFIVPMIESFIRWCEMKKVKYIEIGITTEVCVEKTKKLLSRFGFVESGTLMKLVRV